MNYELSHIPTRSQKPRKEGLTMVMDKGLSFREIENMLASSGEYIDIVKFGFGTSLLTPCLKEKIALLKEKGVKVYFGGTLFEAFVARGKFDEYLEYLKEYDTKYVEVSDGVLPMPTEQKCEYISELAKEHIVFSEVGYKTGERSLSIDEWVRKIRAEHTAGAWKIIAEARESGNIGIFKNDGTANEELINAIRENIAAEDVIWEAPLKKQQVWFIKLLGANVNLGNIAYNEIIPLETLRRGLRGDTLLDFLPEYK